MTDYDDRPLFDMDQIQEIVFRWMDMAAEEKSELQESKDKWKLAARKSNYLYRILGAGQKHRTKICPTHKGHWSGYAFPYRCECSLGTYDITGWLPEPGDETPRLGTCEFPGCKQEATVEWTILRTGERHIMCPDHK